MTAVTLTNQSLKARRAETSPPIPESPGGSAADRWVQDRLAAQLELLVRCAAARSWASAMQVLVEEVQRFSGCKTVALGLMGTDRRCRLTAVSDSPRLDSGSESFRQLEAALGEAARFGDLTTWDGPEASPQLAAHGDLAAAFKATSIVTAPLTGSQGNLKAMWTFVGKPTNPTKDELQLWLQACSHVVGGQIELLERAFESPWVRLLRAAGQWCRQRGVWIAVAVILALCLCFIRIPYQVAANSVLQPVVRRFVAAPFEGQLERCLVKPGDLVEKGQCLARMEGRDLRSELASLTAEAEQAAKEYDVNLAAGKRAAAQTAGLEVERLKQRRRVIEHRIEQIEIRCPIAGVVISGDLERSESAAVSLGQPLVEVAPLDALVCEIEIPDTEIAHIQVGQPLRIALDSLPGKTLTGTLERIHPRSEIREQRNVFIGQVSLDNESGGLRPGMKGRVRIATSSRTLAWIAFHKPWNWLSAWWDW